MSHEIHSFIVVFILVQKRRKNFLSANFEMTD